MQALNEIPIFRGVNEDELEKLLTTIHFQRKKFRPGSPVVSQGEECNRLLLLISGTVKGEMTSPTGKSLTIEEMSAPYVLASAFLFGRNNAFPVNIIPLTEVEFVIIPREELLKIFQQNVFILKNFLGMVSSRAQFLSEKIRFHSFKSLKSKIAFYLIQESGGKSTFKLKQTQNELAELFGAARPSIGRIFLSLQEEGIIDIRYKQVSILNLDRLQDACEE
jgi:CRP/FNR family transcriptional regulator, dissimilatory nitrate respiration regulator